MAPTVTPKSTKKVSFAGEVGYDDNTTGKLKSSTTIKADAKPVNITLNIGPSAEPSSSSSGGITFPALNPELEQNSDSPYGTQIIGKDSGCCSIS